jgi:hypothetical protein
MTSFKPEEAMPQPTNKQKWDFFMGENAKGVPPPAGAPNHRR